MADSVGCLGRDVTARSFCGLFSLTVSIPAAHPLLEGRNSCHSRMAMALEIENGVS